METQYPKRIIIDNPRLTQILEEKNDMVMEGREKSIEIEEYDVKLAELDKQMVAIEQTVDISDLDEQAKVVTEKTNAILAEMKEIEQARFNRCDAAIPQELKDEYKQLGKIKEEKENERNKIGLKVQKWKDKIIKMTQNTAKDYLKEEFEDFNDIRMENGELILEIFSHLEDYKKLKRNQIAKKYQ